MRIKTPSPRTGLVGAAVLVMIAALFGVIDTAGRAAPAEPTPSESAKPKVWIYTDMSDKTLEGSNKEGTLNDPDDISAMAGYVLMSNAFETLGIVVASTHRDGHRDSPDQAEWADATFNGALAAERENLNRIIGGYPERLPFMESCIKKTGERYRPGRAYESLDDYPTVQALLDAAETLDDGEVIHVLCWGSLTEPAILVNHCLATGNHDILDKLRFIAHWTNSSFRQGSVEHPEDVANCREDARACAYLKDRAAAGDIVYYECSAIGQHGIVGGSPKGHDYFDAFRASQLGTLFVEGKFVHNSVDHSDAATYWALLGGYGVSLDDIAPDGTNPPETERRNEQAFREHSRAIHDELLRRSNAAAGRG